MSNRRLTIKDPTREIQLFRVRALIVSVIILVFAGVLFVRLFYLQIYHHQRYVTLSEQNQLNLVPIEPNRGLIFDRNGILLAENIPVFSLEIIPRHHKRYHLKTTLAELRKIIPLSDEEIEQFYKQRKQRRRFEPIPLRTRLTEEEVARFSVNQYRFPGVFIKSQLIRHYPLGEKMVAALGYVGRINERELKKVDPSNYSATNFIGKVGIERYYESELHGNVGYQHVEIDATGRVVRVLKSIPPVHGDNLYLSLDSQLQTVAFDALGDLHGAVVAIEPRTGQVLALVSSPSYDPNLFVDGISRTAFQQLQTDPGQPLYNRSLRGQYPPGSTIKPIVGLAGLESGVVSPQYHIFDPGWFQLENSSHIYHDWQRRGHGTVNMMSAVIHSCDTYFFTLAHKLGIKRIDEIMSRFGFGERTGIDIREELPGLLPSPEWKKRTQHTIWYPGDTLISGIGQGFMLATPLQLASAVSTLSMRGLRLQPSLLLHRQTADGSVQTSTPIQLAPVTLQDSTWTLIINAMEGVITEGTGGTHFGRDALYPVAAKTGTAQVFSLKKNERYRKDLLPQHLRDNSLFIAFAPIEHPQIAIAVMVEHSEEAGSIARKVMDFYLLQQKKIAPLPKAETKPVSDNSPKDEEEEIPAEEESTPVEDN